MPLKGARFFRTLILRGGNPFELRIPGNPAVSHEGGTTAQHLYITEEEAALISEKSKENGAVVDFVPMTPNPPQQEERRKLFQRPEEVFLLCEECLFCPWYDPITLGEGKTCSLREAPKEATQTLMQNSNPHRKAAILCPLKE